MSSTSQRSGFGQYINLLFNIGDLVVINVLFWIVISLFPVVKTVSGQLRELWLVINVGYFPVIMFTRWSRHELRAIRMERVMRNALLTVAAHAVFLLSMEAFLRITVFPARAFFTYYGLLAIALTAFRTGGSYALKAYRRRGFNFTRVVIVGTGRTARRLYEAMSTDAGFGYCVMCFFHDTPEPGFDLGEVRPISELNKYMSENDIRQVFFTLSGHSESLAQVVKICDDHISDFYYVPQLPRTLTRSMEFHNIGPLPMLSIRRNPLQSVFNRALKRGFDIVISSLFLLFYPLVYIPVAIAIKITSPGPVYFKQERTGYLGKTFNCLKFRTMRVNADADKLQATHNDPRKTCIGDFLRRTSIDELPQFINVLRGDMSVVGPRPHMLMHTELYTSLVDSYMVRHAVKPGITGWAQVNGYRGITDELWKMERRVEHDVWYIENWTLLLDLKIIVRTVINAFGGEKNAF
ncbi:MAG: undecaprenyl-phosphate glucose phosphotransferase [Muribaculaceae bacterium]|jgi:putative colanic acid biosynthesis UDP-glucose lipid carrier transferase|nr:undecaprenyl-phosphate glucose phosphotransferase [Muribaculaceae bacterium]